MIDTKHLMKQQVDIYAVAKEGYENGNKIKINNREYSLIPNINHSQRLEFLQYKEDTAARIKPFEYSVMEEMLKEVCMCDGQLLKNADTHFDKHPEDYKDYIMQMQELVTYPFLKGKITDFLNLYQKDSKETL